MSRRERLGSGSGANRILLELVLGRGLSIVGVSALVCEEADEAELEFEEEEEERLFVDGWEGRSMLGGTRASNILVPCSSSCTAVKGQCTGKSSGITTNA